MKEFKRITFDSNIMGGQACIRGMRMQVSLVIVLSVLLLAGILALAIFYSNKSGKLCTPDHNTHQESEYASIPEREKVHQPNKPLKSEISQKTQKLQMPFIANDGQVDNQVAFYAKTFGGTVFVTKEGEIVYSLPGYSSKSSDTGCMMHDSRNEFHADEYHVSCIFHHKSAIPHCSYCLVADINKHTKQNTTIRGWVLKEELVDGSIQKVMGEEPSVTKISYFIGNDPSKHKNNIQTYNLVNLGEVYEGIDLRLRAYGNNVEKLFYVKPDTDPETIQIKLSGARGLNINEDGLLEVDTALGLVKFTKPVAYQEIDGKRVKVNVYYQIQNSGVRGHNTETSFPCQKSEFQNPNSEAENIYGFKVASYDKTKELVIDPLLASTYLGGSGIGDGKDYGYFVSIDSSGNIYVAGQTSSSNFPTTIEAYNITYNGGSDDAFISKLNHDLTILIASTYIGGSNNDWGGADEWVASIAIDPSGNICVTGMTSSSDFPTTIGAYDTSYGGDRDAFVSKLNSDLTNLLASTFLGGSERDHGGAIAIDQNGNIYAAGHTDSSDFPITTGAYDTSYGGYGDAFVSKLNSDLTNLLASTYLGGSSDEWGNSIVLDPDGNVFLAGDTESSDFPSTPSAYDISFNGVNSDTFVSKLNSDLTNLLSSTYLGGTFDEWGNSIATDSSGNIYLAGETNSSDFPTTTNAYDTSYNGGYGDAFISKLNSDFDKPPCINIFGRIF